MENNNKDCINSKEKGSVWGTITNWAKLDDIALSHNSPYNTDLDKCVRFEQLLYDYDCKIYAWFKDYTDGRNYFIET